MVMMVVVVVLRLWYSTISSEIHGLKNPVTDGSTNGPIDGHTLYVDASKNHSLKKQSNVVSMFNSCALGCVLCRFFPLYYVHLRCPRSNYDSKFFAVRL